MKEILDAVSSIDKKMDENKRIAEEVKSATDKKISEFDAMMAKYKQEHIDEVKALNEEGAKANKSLEEIRAEVLELKAKGGKFKTSAQEEKSTQSMLAEAFLDKFDEIKAVRKGKGADLELKAVGIMTLTNNSGGAAPSTWAPAVAVRGRRKVNFRDLVRIIPTATGTWKFFQQNAVVGEGAIDVQGSPGGTKANLDYDVTEQTVNVRFIAGFVRFDKGMASDLPFLQNFISSELVEDFKRVETGIFLPRLCNVAAGSPASASTPLAEKYIDYIATLMSNDYDPTAIITTAANWATVLKTKPNDYSIPGGLTIDADGNVRFVGIPLLAQNNMVAGRTLIGDFSKAALVQAEGMSVQFFEQDSDNVQKNLITARIEAREDLAVFRPDAFIYA
jgi:HK97 family phage major capsid protein